MAKSKAEKVSRVGVVRVISHTSIIFQMERQSEKMEVENLMETVDSEWKAVQNLLYKAVC